MDLRNLSVEDVPDLTKEQVEVAIGFPHPDKHGRLYHHNSPVGKALREWQEETEQSVAPIDVSAELAMGSTLLGGAPATPEGHLERWELASLCGALITGHVRTHGGGNLQTLKTYVNDMSPWIEAFKAMMDGNTHIDLSRDRIKRLERELRDCQKELGETRDRMANMKADLEQNMAQNQRLRAGMPA